MSIVLIWLVHFFIAIIFDGIKSGFKKVFGNLPNANNSVLPDGRLNLNKRGSDKSPGAGLQNSTQINMGMGYQWSSMLSLGVGFSHRIKLAQNNPNILSHSYRLQTIYDIVSLGTNFKYEKHDFFLVCSYGFRNRVSGLMPKDLGRGQFVGEKQNIALSISWGYKY